ncbi:flagellar protein FlgN [Nesterenkonia pannonica]|uniref:flagellar protein FlgN n=1 Tax=Nesterenkonia pannonica TaxID=1548602 RepID=UPI002164B621|nr:flagellar protein FlgN [Nesterenkonia pannonica]
MTLNSLTALLWRERELLDLLEFKMEEQQLLLVSGKTQWLDRATREIDTVVEKVSAASLARAVESAEVAASLNLDGDSTLGQITQAVTEPAWRDILENHLSALRATAERIAALKDTNTTILRGAQRATQETLASLDSDTYTYDQPRQGGSDPSPRLLDTEL